MEPALENVLLGRFHDGDHAQQLLQTEMAHHLTPNLFNSYPPFQIDGNLGTSAAIPEMLLQSQAPPTNPATGDQIRLPALPNAWPNGHVTGLFARGGFEVEMTWKDGSCVEAKLLSKLGRPGAHPRAGMELVDATASHPETDVLAFPTDAGKVYVLRQIN